MKARVTLWVVLSLLATAIALLCGCQAAEPTPVSIDTGLPATPDVATSTPPPVTPPASVDASVPAEWLIYDDAVYGFSIAYPADWMTKDLPMGGPGTPDDWPVQKMVVFFPASMAASLDRSGPPDPNAPAAIPPFSVEVCTGTVAQFRRAYPEPGMVEEGLEVNGLSMVVERDMNEDFNTVRYVYSQATTPDTRVVVVDAISGFSERAAANPEYLRIIARAAASVELAGE